MKKVLKLEELGMLILISLVYFKFYNGDWSLFLGLFFVPDLAFLFYLLHKKAGAIGYNIAHHKGVISLLLFIGYEWNSSLILKIGLIFLAHSCFDRIAGYGLKYLDDFDHTHLGWIGKSKHKNE